MLTQDDYDFLCRFRNESVKHIEFDDFFTLRRIEWLVSLGFLRYERRNVSAWVANDVKAEEFDLWVTIEPAGLSALSCFEKSREEQAKNERQQRFQNKVAVATVLVPAITFVLGLVVEHFAGIMNLFFSLFQH